MQSIYQDVRHMNKLTQTLLEFAKASGNPGGLEINLVRIDEIIFRLPYEISKINSSYTVTLQFQDLPDNEENLLVFGNEDLLLMAIKNIVINACKYSDDKRAVIGLEIHPKMIIIGVSDQGKGIPENELKTIFQPFYRVDENVSNQGFGLGLSLADRVIKLHKGTIEVNSVVGTGTTFFIKIPTAGSLS
jgi:two-component system sensor histidine kinase ArlS